MSNELRLLWELGGSRGGWPSAIIASSFGGRDAFAIGLEHGVTMVCDEISGELLGEVDGSELLAAHPDGGIVGDFEGTLLSHLIDPALPPLPLGFLGCEPDLSECWSSGVGVLDGEPVVWRPVDCDGELQAHMSGPRGEAWATFGEHPASDVMRLTQVDIVIWDVIDREDALRGTLTYDVVDWNAPKNAAVGVGPCGAVVLVLSDQTWRFVDHRWSKILVGGRAHLACSLAVEAGVLFAVATDVGLVVIGPNGEVVVERSLDVIPTAITMVGVSGGAVIAWADTSDSAHTIALQQGPDSSWLWGPQRVWPGVLTTSTYYRSAVAIAIDAMGRMLVAVQFQNAIRVLRDHEILFEVERHALDPVYLCFGRDGNRLAIGYARPAHMYREYVDVYQIPDEPQTNPTVALLSGSVTVVKTGDETSVRPFD